MEILMIRTQFGHLAPMGDEAAAELRKIKAGAVVECKVTRKRHPEFHRKVFALFQTCFDAWREVAPMVEYKGERVMPNFNRMRKDMTVLAGFYDPVFNLNGELRLEAKSLSFSNMEQDEFEACFSALIQVALDRVLGAQGYTPESLRAHVERVLAFD